MLVAAIRMIVGDTAPGSFRSRSERDLGAVLRRKVAGGSFRLPRSTPQGLDCRPTSQEGYPGSLGAWDRANIGQIFSHADCALADDQRADMTAARDAECSLRNPGPSRVLAAQNGITYVLAQLTGFRGARVA